jgi:hypothetical protein
MQAPVSRLWDIEYYSDGGPGHYFFAEDNELYRITARGEAKQMWRAVKRYIQGYVLKSRFYSLSQLRPMLRQHDRTAYPTGF